VNFESGYECQCSPGYNDTNPSDGTVSCVDINECLTDVCGSNADCTNVPGTYSCRCKRGKTKTGVRSDGS
jgi:fibulin 1/2